MHLLLINIITVLSIFGLLVSFYIYNKKKKKKKLVCPRHSDCDTVIHSDYSRILGIPIEVLGIVYYVFIGYAYCFVFIFNIWSARTALVLVGVSMCALLFSIYLVAIQAFVVRQWCIWCLSSAATTLLILILSVWNLRGY